MLRNFVTGKGAENYYFKENGIISSKFFKSHILNKALKNYLDSPDEYRGGHITFGVLSLFNDIRQNMTLSSVTGMTGSANVTLLPTERGLEIKIFNVTSLTSGAFGKELGKVLTRDNSLYPKSIERNPRMETPYGNITQTFNLFISWGDSSKGESKLDKIKNVYIYSQPQR